MAISEGSSAFKIADKVCNVDSIYSATAVDIHCGVEGIRLLGTWRIAIDWRMRRALEIANRIRHIDAIRDAIPIHIAWNIVAAPLGKALNIEWGKAGYRHNICHNMLVAPE